MGVRMLAWPLAGLVASTAVFFAGLYGYNAKVLAAEPKAGTMPTLPQQTATMHTTRIGTDDPVETAVAVSNIVYPVTEEENSPGAVVLVNRNEQAEAMAAASRVQHFPVNAPILYVDAESMPPATVQELVRLNPEGVPMDGNRQVYLVGTIGEAVRREVEAMGFRTRTFKAADPIALAEQLDTWSSTQHGDHRNDVIIANLDRLDTAIPGVFWNAHKGDGFAYVTDDGIPEATHRMLSRRANGPWIYVFGDESVVSDATVAELARYGHVTRIPKPDFTGTAPYFAGFKDQGRNWGAWFWAMPRQMGWGIAEAGHNAIFVNLDGPAGWANALCATTLSHMGKHAPVLAVERDGVPEATASYLEVIKPYVTAPQQQLLDHGWVIGGEGTISKATQARLDQLLAPRGLRTAAR